MKNFKYIKVLSNKQRYKLVKTTNEGNDFDIEFELIDGKVRTKFIKMFSLDQMSFWDRLKYCYRILVDKKMEMVSEFEFKNGEHVVDVSDTLYIFSREINKN